MGAVGSPAQAGDLEEAEVEENTDCLPAWSVEAAAKAACPCFQSGELAETCVSSRAGRGETGEQGKWIPEAAEVAAGVQTVLDSKEVAAAEGQSH